MSLIICIETATISCSVVLAKDGHAIGKRELVQENVHAEMLTVFISELLAEHHVLPQQLDAVAVSKGPGSYTGLRIGVSVAKGLCFGTGIRLIAVNTLEAMASGLAATHDLPAGTLLCPMIDARRMEVYCAMYDLQGNCTLPTAAVIVEEGTFRDILSSHPVVFFGDGAHKCKTVLENKNSRFLDNIHPSASHLAAIAERKFAAQDVENIAYFEPYYLKEFVGTSSPVKK